MLAYVFSENVCMCVLCEHSKITLLHSSVQQLSKPSRYETIVLPSGILFGAQVLVCNINDCHDII